MENHPKINSDAEDIIRNFKEHSPSSGAIMDDEDTNFFEPDIYNWDYTGVADYWLSSRKSGRRRDSTEKLLKPKKHASHQHDTARQSKKLNSGAKLDSAPVKLEVDIPGNQTSSDGSERKQTRIGCLNEDKEVSETPTESTLIKTAAEYKVVFGAGMVMAAVVVWLIYLTCCTQLNEKKINPRQEPRYTSPATPSLKYTEESHFFIGFYIFRKLQWVLSIDQENQQ